MKKALFFINKGFSLAEILVSISVFLVFSLAFFGLFKNSITQIIHTAQKERAVALAEEGLEAVRNIKEADFNNLADGNYGLSVSGNHYELSGAFEIEDIFTRVIKISGLENDSSIKKAQSEVFWQNNKSVSLVTYFTDWAVLSEYFLTISSSAGGQVVEPGEGEFVFPAGEEVVLAAEAEAGYFFNQWLGDVENITDPQSVVTIIVMMGDYNIFADFLKDDFIIETCRDYCVSAGYFDGICRQNPRQCQRNNEIHEQGGNEFCPGGPQKDCCCK